MILTQVVKLYTFFCPAPARTFDWVAIMFVTKHIFISGSNPGRSGAVIVVGCIHMRRMLSYYVISPSNAFQDFRNLTLSLQEFWVSSSTIYNVFFSL